MCIKRFLQQAPSKTRPVFLTILVFSVFSVISLFATGCVAVKSSTGQKNHVSVDSPNQAIAYMITPSSAKTSVAQWTIYIEGAGYISLKANSAYKLSLPPGSYKFIFDNVSQEYGNRNTYYTLRPDIPSHFLIRQSSEDKESTSEEYKIVSTRQSAFFELIKHKALPLSDITLEDFSPDKVR